MAVYSISGNVVVTGATVKAVKGVSVYTTISSPAGDYTIASLSAGTYIVTPTLAGYGFLPESKSVIITTANITGVDFNGIRESRREIITQGIVKNLQGISQTSGYWNNISKVSRRLKTLQQEVNIANNYSVIFVFSDEEGREDFPQQIQADFKVTLLVYGKDDSDNRDRTVNRLIQDIDKCLVKDRNIASVGGAGTAIDCSVEKVAPFTMDVRSEFEIEIILRVPYRYTRGGGE